MDPISNHDATAAQNFENESSWNFIEKSIYNNNNDSSDDDSSIVIIEREVQRDSTPILTSGSESENEETESYTDVVINSSSPATTDTKDEMNVIMPLYNAQRLAFRSASKIEDEFQDEFRWSWVSVLLLIYMFAMLAVNFISIIGIPYSYFPMYRSGDSIVVSDPAIIELLSSIRTSKLMVDDIYSFQHELLIRVERTEKDLFSLNLTKMKTSWEKSKKVDSHLSSFKEWSLVFDSLLISTSNQPQCQDEVVYENLPLVCHVNHDLFLKMNSEQFKSFFNNTASFLHNTSSKYKEMNNDLAHFLLHKMSAKDNSNIFVQDSDNFSKHYKPNFCSKDDDINLCDSKNLEEKSYGDAGNKIRVESLKSQELPEAKLPTKELLNLMIKFKNDFEHLYKLYLENEEELEAITNNDNLEEMKESEDSIDATSDVTSDTEPMDVSNHEEEPKLVKESSESSQSGEWLFDMYAARDRLRQYYEHVITGEWIFKLGKLREKLRTESSKKNPLKKESHKHKEKHSSKGSKGSEKKQWNFKRISSKLESTFTKMKDGLKRKYNKYVDYIQSVLT